MTDGQHDEPAVLAPTVEGLLARLHHVIASARSMPLSTSVLVNRDEALDLVEAVQSGLPHELRQARWLLKDREELLAKAGREADDVLAAARTRAERMVQRTEITREAERSARSMLETAQLRVREMHHEAEDFVDQKLAAFEALLDRTARELREARDEFQLPAEAPVEEPAALPTPFDQDE